jgi:hypothetical protein
VESNCDSGRPRRQADVDVDDDGDEGRDPPLRIGHVILRQPATKYDGTHCAKRIKRLPDTRFVHPMHELIDTLLAGG